MTLTESERKARAVEASRRWAEANRERVRANAAAYRARDPERTERIQRNSKMKAKYGITLDDYEAMLETQDGHCAICPATTPGRANRRYLYVDHDHETGAVRGLLCGNCNDGLGRFIDDIDLLTSAIMYLMQHQTDGED